MIIYKTINLENGKWYIGQDSKNQPRYLGSGTILKQAIKLYGRKKFKKEILQICNSKEELNKAEKEWIGKTNAVNDINSYNLIEGGNTPPIMRGDKNVNYKKIPKAVEVTSKPVICLTNGNIYSSVCEAARSLNLWYSRVLEVCNLNSENTENFVFRFIGEENLKFTKINCKKRQVINVDTKEVFKSKADAAFKYGSTKNGSNIGGAIKKGHLAYGCHWEYV